MIRRKGHGRPATRRAEICRRAPSDHRVGRPGSVVDVGFDRVAREPPVGPATGFWRLERPAGALRTWLFAPDGRATFLLGINTVMRDVRCAAIRQYIRRHDPTTAANVEWARLSDGESGGRQVPRPYWFNSVGAFSDINDFDDSGGDSYMIRPAERGGAGAPYGVVLDVAARGDDRALKDERGAVLISGLSDHRLGDPFNPAFLADLDALVQSRVVARCADPRLQMWFAGNEIGIFDLARHGPAGVRDFRRWIWSDVPAGSSIDRPLCARHALAAFLCDHYEGSIGALNRAWDSTYPDFEAIVGAGPHPVPYVHDCNARCGEDLQRFVHDGLLREWVRAVTTRIRAADPHHIIAAPRLAVSNARTYRFWSGRGQPDPDHWTEPPADAIGDDTDRVRYSPLDLLARDGRAGFDLVAVNVYTGAATFPRPWFTDGIHRLQQQSGLPVLISEFGIRAQIDGWSNRGGAGAFVPHRDDVDDQLQRGRRYGSQIDQFIGFTGIVGATWHAWSDRFDPIDSSRQINLGLVQCTDRARAMRAGARWMPADALVAETNRTINQRIGARTGF
jgi:hypothetical protein